MRGPVRIARGLLTDASQPVRFQFNGHPMLGLAGDTLASALLANGQRMVARSFKYHRPRGILAAGSEDPAALVHVGGDAARADPNTRATEQEVYEGLVARAQNCWPTLRFDTGAVADLGAPFIPAG